MSNSWCNEKFAKGCVMQRFLFWVVGIVFFVVYFIVLQFIYNKFVPLTPFTDVLSLFIIAVVIWPLSAVSAQWFIHAVRTAK